MSSLLALEAPVFPVALVWLGAPTLRKDVVDHTIYPRSDTRMRVRNFTLLFAAFAVLPALSVGQDKFSIVRLTTDPAQEGFPTWTRDGKFILFARIARDDTLGKTGLWQISPDGKQLSQIYSGLAEHPQLSPDGRLIVYDADSGKSMRMIDTGGGSPKKFIPDSIGILKGGMPLWSPTGSHIVFKEGTTSCLCVYDVNTGSVARIFCEGGLVPLPGCWSQDGKSILMALLDKQTRKCTMWQISPDGEERKQITGHHDGFYRYMALSPDGSLLAYAAMEGRDLGLWIMPAKGGKSLPLAVTHPGHNEGPAWSPDGRQLAFASTRSGGHDIWLMNLDIDQLRDELRSLNR
jgi:TolB protein